MSDKRIQFFHIWKMGEISTSAPAETIINNWQNISKVVFFSGTEYAYHLSCREVPLLEAAVDACNKYNIPFIFLTSTYTYDDIPLIDWSQDRYKNATIVDWPAYWIASMACMINNVPSTYEKNCSLGNDIRDPNLGLNNDIKYLYLTLVNQPKYHRCVMMDILCKYDLIDKGAISWRDVFRQFDEYRADIVSESVLLNIYDWKYWTPKKLSLTDNDDFTSSFPEWWILPKQYSNAFMQIVPECSDTTFLVSEKAAIPILFKKIFLVAGPKNYHSNLVDMGFKLYDELFDYSFDSIDDLELRIEGMIQNVNRYRDKTPEELNEIINSVSDKLSFNRSHGLKLTREMPKLWAELVEEANNIEYIEYLTTHEINNLTIY